MKAARWYHTPQFWKIIIEEINPSLWEENSVNCLPEHIATGEFKLNDNLTL